jgi:hypothetical protein
VAVEVQQELLLQGAEWLQYRTVAMLNL